MNHLIGDKKVNKLGFGAWPLGNVSGKETMTTDAGIHLVKKAIEAGINFFDTAPNYAFGRSEVILGEAIKGGRDEVIINTKFGHHANDQQDFDSNLIEPSLLGSLERLQTTYIDSLLLHNPPLEILKGNTDHFEKLETLKKAGLIRAYGVSIDTLEELELTLNNLKVDVIELLFNVFFQDTKKLFKEIQDRKITLIIKVPLDSGWLTGKYHKGLTFEGIKSRWTDAVKNRRDHHISMIKKETKETELTNLAIGFINAFEAVSTIIPGIEPRINFMNLFMHQNTKLAQAINYI